MTYREIYRRLSSAGIDNADTDAALLLEHFCGVSRASLPFRRDEDFSSPALAEAVERRESRCPLQYILGRWGFCGLEFYTAPGVLIPRADTELIATAAINALPPGARIADLGCGSGCIGITVLHARPDVTCTSVDISPAALELTQKNAGRYGIGNRLRLLEGNMLEQSTWQALGRLTAVISNPPYIPHSELAGLAPELAFEPAEALDGGSDGLDFYRVLISRGAASLDSQGFILFECGTGQSADISALGKAVGLEPQVLYDIEKRDRAVMLRRE